MRNLTRRDREAMARAIEQLRQQGGEKARQIEDKLASEAWEEVGAFASYSCQDANLRLKPWQVPPCWIRTAGDLKAALAQPHDHSGLRAAGELVRRLLAAGLSRFEPDPIIALAHTEASSPRPLSRNSPGCYAEHRG
jgi:hypothetical protein